MCVALVGNERASGPTFGEQPADRVDKIKLSGRNGCAACVSAPSSLDDTSRKSGEGPVSEHRFRERAFLGKWKIVLKH